MITQNEPNKDKDLNKLIEAIPGARAVRFQIDSQVAMQFRRDHFRTDERLKTALKLIEVSKDETDRTVAADSLGYFGPYATSALMRALKQDTSWRVRLHAVVALGKTGDLKATPAIEAALHDPDHHVRQAAAEALDVLKILSNVSPPQIYNAESLRREINAQADEETPVTAQIDFEELMLASQLENKGNANLATGLFAEALTNFEELIKIAPQYAPGYIGRGSSYEKLGRIQLAVADYTKAIELEMQHNAIISNEEKKELASTLARAYQRRAICWRMLENWAKALPDVERALEIDSSDSQSWYNLGVTLIHFEEYERAQKAFDHAIQIRPDYVQAYFNRGVLYMQEDRFRDAIEDFSKGLSYDAQNAIGYFNRAQAYIQLGEEKLANADLERALLLDPTLINRLERNSL